MNNESAKPKMKQWKFYLVMLIGIFVFIAVVGILYRIWESITVKNATQAEAITTVAVIIAKNDLGQPKIILPGNVTAWHETTIYARTDGYVLSWLVDIGSQVKKGDLLAVLTAPEVVAQLQQTEANLKTAEANSALANSTAKRWLYLLKSDSVSKQETDEKVSDAEAKAAIVQSTIADRDRLRDLVSFQKITAPFNGIIMARRTDVGHLINAGSTGNVPLFQLVQGDKLRIYVRVPEYWAKQIRPDLVADLSFREHPGKIYKAKLLNTAKAIDAPTRTLLIQLEIDNQNYELLPGSYAEVHINLTPSSNYIVLPINTLIFDAKGLRVATVNTNNQVAFKPIMVGRDFGDSIEVTSGISPGEKIIVNPPDYLFSSQKVAIATANKIHREKIS